MLFSQIIHMLFVVLCWYAHEKAAAGNPNRTSRAKEPGLRGSESYQYRPISTVSLISISNIPSNLHNQTTVQSIHTKEFQDSREQHSARQSVYDNVTQKGEKQITAPSVPPNKGEDNQDDGRASSTVTHNRNNQADVNSTKHNRHDNDLDSLSPDHSHADKGNNSENHDMGVKDTTDSTSTQIGNIWKERSTQSRQENKHGRKYTISQRPHKQNDIGAAKTHEKEESKGKDDVLEEKNKVKYRQEGIGHETEQEYQFKTGKKAISAAHSGIHTGAKRKYGRKITDEKESASEYRNKHRNVVTSLSGPITMEGIDPYEIQSHDPWTQTAELAEKEDEKIGENSGNVELTFFHQGNKQRKMFKQKVNDEEMQTTGTDSVFSQVGKADTVAGELDMDASGTLLIPDDSEQSSETATVLISRNQHGNRSSGTNHWNQVLMAALRDWAMPGTKKNRLKRTRREIPDGSGLVLRAPVVATKCRCPVCNYTKAAYDIGEYENAAFNKVASVSSVFKGDGDDVSPNGCGAVNGLTEHVLRYIPRSKFPNCFQTRIFYQDLAWWSVDLAYVYTFKYMILFRRQGNFGQEGMAATSVYLDGRICFRFTADKGIRLPLIYKLKCDYIMTARRIRFQKRENAVQSFSRYLHFCELQVWVCKMGTYGEYPGSCKPCPEQCKYTCNNYFGCDRQILFNVAIGKTVRTSLLAKGNPQNLIDGVHSLRHPETCAITFRFHRQSNHWFGVMLGSTFKVFSVNVHSRKSGYSTLTRYYVIVSDVVKFPFPPPPKFNCGLEKRRVRAGTAAMLRCIKPISGKYVFIARRSIGGLYVCEIEVFGHHRYILRVGSKCINVSETAVCVSDSVCDNKTCKWTVGSKCRIQRCVTGSVCEGGRCKLKLDRRCNPAESHCRDGTECDPKVGKCKSSLGSQCEKGQCASNTVCDTLLNPGLCKKEVNQTCQKTLDCIIGAVCEQGKCKCNTHVGNQAGNQCKPVKGRIGSDCTASDCQFGKCEDGKCVCSAEESTFAEDFSCKPKAGSACSSSKPCNTGLQCINGECKIPVGDNCYGNVEFCTAGTMCDFDFCKLNTGQNCADHQDMCRSGNVCSGGKCKVTLGENCQNNKDLCVVGMCSTGDSNTCKLDAGQNCSSDRQIQCRSGTVCEDGQVCKIDIAEPCSKSSLCRTGSVCGSRQGSKGNKCRRPIGSVDCRTDEDCVDTTVCDSQKLCRIAKSGDCQNRPGLCLAGSTCTGGTCQCNQEVTDPQSAKCDPKAGKVGGACKKGTSTSSCDDLVAQCWANHTCQCQSSFATDTVDLVCSIDAGFPCSAVESTTPCIHGATCVDSRCALEEGELCTGHRQGYCRINSVCDVDGICRFNVHGNCSGEPLHCKQGTVCDSLKRCKVRPSGTCNTDSECVAGSRCDNGTCVCSEGVTKQKNGTCVPDEGRVGGKCREQGCYDTLAQCNQDTGLCQCQPGFSPDTRDFTCSKISGEICAEDSECMTGLVCDPATSKCKIQVGQMCDGENKENCIAGAVCDYDSVCKLDLLGNCSGENSIFCRSGLFCDLLEQCSHGFGDSCNVTETGKDTCIAGATCTDSFCECDQDISSVNGAICEPKQGRYGALCSSTADKCEVDNSQCTDDFCVCKPGYKPDRKFNCVIATAKQVSSGKMTVLLVILGALGLLAAAVAVVTYRRQKHKKAARQEVLAHGTASLKDIAKLDEDVSTMMETSSYVGTSTAVASSVAATYTSMVDSSTVMESSVAESVIH